MFLFSFTDISTDFLKLCFKLLSTSDLFSTTILLSFIKLCIFLFKEFDVLSITTRFKSASLDLLSANKIPFFSISFFASLIPAVSAKMTG